MLVRGALHGARWRANGSRILLIGTPWGGKEQFFRLAFERGEDGDPDYSSHRWTHVVNPNLDPCTWSASATLSPVEYAAEILGEWSDATGRFFRRDLLDAATAPVVIPPLASLSPPARGIAGIDYGVNFDRSAVVAIYRLPIGTLNPDADPKPRFIALPYVYLAGALLSDVVDDVFAIRPALAYVSTETTGVGAGPSQQLYGLLARDDVPVRINRVATTAAKKTAAFGCVLRLLERGQLILPKHPDLLQAAFRPPLRAGRSQLQVRAGQPDDTRRCSGWAGAGNVAAYAQSRRTDLQARLAQQPARRT